MSVEKKINFQKNQKRSLETIIFDVSSDPSSKKQKLHASLPNPLTTYSIHDIRNHFSQTNNVNLIENEEKLTQRFNRIKSIDLLPDHFSIDSTKKSIEFINSVKKKLYYEQKKNQVVKNIDEKLGSFSVEDDTLLLNETENCFDNSQNSIFKAYLDDINSNTNDYLTQHSQINDAKKINDYLSRARSFDEDCLVPNKDTCVNISPILNVSYRKCDYFNQTVDSVARNIVFDKSQIMFFNSDEYELNFDDEKSYNEKTELELVENNVVHKFPLNLKKGEFESERNHLEIKTKEKQNKQNTLRPRKVELTCSQQLEINCSNQENYMDVTEIVSDVTNILTLSVINEFSDEAFDVKTNILQKTEDNSDGAILNMDKKAQHNGSLPNNVEVSGLKTLNNNDISCISHFYFNDTFENIFESKCVSSSENSKIDGNEISEFEDVIQNLTNNNNMDASKNSNILHNSKNDNLKDSAILKLFDTDHKKINIRKNNPKNELSQFLETIENQKIQSKNDKTPTETRNDNIFLDCLNSDEKINDANILNCGENNNSQQNIINITEDDDMFLQFIDSNKKNKNDESCISLKGDDIKKIFFPSNTNKNDINSVQKINDNTFLQLNQHSNRKTNDEKSTEKEDDNIFFKFAQTSKKLSNEKSVKECENNFELIDSQKKLNNDENGIDDNIFLQFIEPNQDLTKHMNISQSDKSKIERNHKPENSIEVATNEIAEPQIDTFDNLIIEACTSNVENSLGSMENSETFFQFLNENRNLRSSDNFTSQILGNNEDSVEKNCNQQVLLPNLESPNQNCSLKDVRKEKMSVRNEISSNFLDDICLSSSDFLLNNCYNYSIYNMDESLSQNSFKTPKEFNDKQFSSMSETAKLCNDSSLSPDFSISKRTKETQNLPMRSKITENYDKNVCILSSKSREDMDMDGVSPNPSKVITENEKTQNNQCSEILLNALSTNLSFENHTLNFEEMLRMKVIDSTLQSNNSNLQHESINMSRLVFENHDDILSVNSVNRLNTEISVQKPILLSEHLQKFKIFNEANDINTNKKSETTILPGLSENDASYLFDLIIKNSKVGIENTSLETVVLDNNTFSSSENRKSEMMQTLKDNNLCLSENDLKVSKNCISLSDETLILLKNNTQSKTPLEEKIDGTLFSNTKCSNPELNKEDVLKSEQFYQAFEAPTQFITENVENCPILSQISHSYTFNENSINLTQAFTEVEDFVRNINTENENIQKSSDVEHFIETQTQLTSTEEIISCDVESKSDTLSTGSNENFTSGDKKLRLAFNNISRDKSLLYKGPVVKEFPMQRSKDFVLYKLRDVFFKLHQDITYGRKMVLKVRDFRSWKNVIFEKDRLILKPTNKALLTKIRRNRKTSEHKFKLIIFLLKKMVNLVTLNATCTKREIYYQIVKFVKNQSRVSNAVSTISCMLEIPPWELGILSTGKGLVYGDLRIVLSDEETVHCNIKGGTLIPQDVRKIKRIETNAYFILIVEKDSIFQKLLDEDVPNKLSRPFLLITGKGYADVNTRLFLNKLWMLLSIPVFILVDADPYGIEIMLSYRFGSLSSSFLSEYLAIPKIRWIGVHATEIEILQIEHQPLTKSDIAKITDLLKRPYMESYPAIESELQFMLKNNYKAEIEGLIKCHQFLSNFYLPNKFYTKGFI